LRGEIGGTRGEKLRAVIDRQTIPAPGGGTAAEGPALFENEYGFSGGAQNAGGGQTRDAGSDDEHIAISGFW
jgi:hypothetical protein